MTAPPYTTTIEPQVEYVPFDGLRFKTLLWRAPAGAAYKGRVVLVHGFSEDANVYVEFGDRLSQRGYDVFYFDQRGAGETSAPRDIGRTNEHYVFQDLDFMIRRNLEQKRLPHEKIALVGHLMGGGIVLNYGVKGKYRDSVGAIVASAPMVRLHPSTAPGAVLRAVGAVAYRLAPDFRLDAGLRVDHITRNERWASYIRRSKAKFWISGALHHDMAARGELLTRPDYVARFSPDIRLLVMHSRADQINSYEASRLFYGLVSANVRKEFVTFDEARHSLFLETDDVVAAVLDRVDATLSPS